MKHLLEKLFDWIHEQELEVIGSFDDRFSVEKERTSFMNFLHRLLAAQSQKMDVKAMKPQLRRALYFFCRNKTDPMTAYEMDLMNKLVDNSKLGLVKDDSFRRDLLDLRQEHVAYWPGRYFMRWLDCYEEIDNIRRDVRNKWKDVCIYGASTTVAEPTKTANRMDILLSRYALLTTLFLSPVECAKKWRSLRDNSPETLEQEIKRRANQDFPKIRQLIVDVQNDLAKIGIDRDPLKTGDEGRL